MYLDLGDGVQLFYTIAGEYTGKGKVVVLLHGFTGSSESWKSISQELTSSCKVILPDLLGHGKSSAPEEHTLYRMEAAARQLALLLDRSTDEPVHFVGYSMGGRLALYFAMVYPEYVHSLVLESSSPGLATEAERSARQRADERLAETILSDGIEAFVDHWEALPLFATSLNLSQAVLQQQRRIRLANRPVGLAGSLRGMGTGAQPSLWNRLGTLTIPVRLSAGEFDAKVLEINRRMEHDLPNSSLTVISKAGHATHLEQPVLFTQIIKEFWDRLEPGTT